jgi:hypothetical protein
MAFFCAGSSVLRADAGGVKNANTVEISPSVSKYLRARIEIVCSKDIAISSFGASIIGYIIPNAFIVAKVPGYLVNLVGGRCAASLPSSAVPIAISF